MNRASNTNPHAGRLCCAVWLLVQQWTIMALWNSVRFPKI
jgi:hypothetical protein